MVVRFTTGLGGTAMVQAMMMQQVRRREAVRRGVAGPALGMAGLMLPPLARADAQESGPESAHVAAIYHLQAAFHRAKTTQDIDLMMSLWDPNGTLYNQGDANSPYVGADRLRAFWLQSGSFTHRRFSLVPSFKIQIEVQGDTARLYL